MICGKILDIFLHSSPEPDPNLTISVVSCMLNPVNMLSHENSSVNSPPCPRLSHLYTKSTQEKLEVIYTVLLAVMEV